MVILSLSIHGQTLIDNNNNSIFILDGHSHHVFPELTKSSIASDMNYLYNLGYDAIVFPLPQDRTKRNELSIVDISSDIERIKELSIQGNHYDLYKSAKDLEGNYSPDKISCLFALEYFYGVFNENLGIIHQYKDLGIEYISLINNEYNMLFSNRKKRCEMTDFGLQLLKKLMKLI